MTRTRFVTTLGALLAVFAGGGYVVNHFQGGPNGQITLPETAPSTGDGTVPNAGTSEGVATAPPSETTTPAIEAPAAGTVETQMKKEFDTAAADAAAEAEATNSGSTTAESGATRSAGSEAALVTASLDAVQLSAVGASVIAGQAPTGTTVTLLANDQELASTVSDESGAWTMILEEPVAPGTYKLKLKAVGAKGGEAVFRDVGEMTVKAPETITSAEGTPAGGTAQSTGATSEPTAAPASIEADAQSTAASTPPATPDTAAQIDLTVPEPKSFDIASVPPDLAAPAKDEAEPATEPSVPAIETEASAAEAATVAEPVAPKAEPTAPPATTTQTATAPAEGSADEAASAAASNPAATAAEAPSSTEAETETAEATAADPALADQAGEVAQSLSDMFTDWLTATGDQAAEAAKTFSLTGATYKPVAEDKGVVTLSGRGPPEAEVRVYVDTVAVGVTKIASSGRWLAEADHWIAPGAHSARAEIIGTNGVVLAGHDLAFASVGLPVAVASGEPATQALATEGAETPPVLLAIADVAYENMGPKKGRITVGGRAEPRARVDVFADGTSIGTAEAAESGDWSLASDTWIDVGAHAIRAERIAATGEAVESTLTEFVRPPAEVQVAAAGTPSTEAASEAEATPAVAAVAPAKRKKRHLHKSRKAKLARIAHRKRMASLAAAREARLARARKIRLAKTRGPRLKTVTVQRGNAAVRFKVPAGKRKRRVLGYLHLGGTGWYRVRRGDTLWRIANRCYGNGKHYGRIVAQNERSIRDPDLIYPRQPLYVP